MSKIIKQNTFPIIPANISSLARRKLVFGAGTNDALYIVQPTIKGKLFMCPYYQKWMNMLQETYSSKLHTRQPTYKNTTICDEWLLFSNFRNWMMTQEWHGLELDKDILFPNNKHYSPETCLFVIGQVNTLFSDCRVSRGECKIGVYWRKDCKKYQARLRVNGKIKRLGVFVTEEEAYQTYLHAKVTYIKTFYSQVPKKVKKGLKRHVKLLKKNMLQ